MFWFLLFYVCHAGMSCFPSSCCLYCYSSQYLQKEDVGDILHKVPDVCFMIDAWSYSLYSRGSYTLIQWPVIVTGDLIDFLSDIREALGHCYELCNDILIHFFTVS
jgi:hypothetical protein